ncbi:MAG: tRNA lysidine(34) synthetase TilS [Acutalibacter sp.]|nr:tRNA lysidine(34) synthetase TilS [Acutalibacter sp.]
MLFKNGLDYATIYPKGQAGQLFVRTRKPGDRFSPRGRGLSKPLKQVLREKGVPPWARDRVLLLELSGQIVFCEGIGPAEGFGAERGKDALMVTVKA